MTGSRIGSCPDDAGVPRTGAGGSAGTVRGLGLLLARGARELPRAGVDPSPGPWPDGDGWGSLERAGEQLDVAGRPMYAGVLAGGLPDEPLGRAWTLAERLREHRGDCHVAAFTGAGFDGCAMQVLTERVAGLRPRSYSRTRGWDDDALTAAERLLAGRGLIDGDGAVTNTGRLAREAVEHVTDALWSGPAASLGDDLETLVRTLQRWNADLRAGHAYYPSSPQEATMTTAVRDWVRDRGLDAFPGVPDRPDPAGIPA